jgi:DNA-binding CsgD family transcriptional regulator/chromosome segregation and condensation protein ScpB
MSNGYSFTNPVGRDPAYCQNVQMSAPSTIDPWPVIGREVELEALRTALSDPNCGGVALVGGAGFGKTCLAAQAVRIAVDHGMTFAALRATKSAAAIPFAALTPLFAELDLTPRLDASLLRLVAEAIDLHRGDHRMALIIDDAQELDDASVALLDQLVEHKGVVVVFTVRIGESDAESIVGKWKDQEILRIEVGPLPDEELRTLAVMAIGGPVDGATLQSLVESSGGNVLFLRELIQGALESGALTSELGLWRLRGSLAHSPRLRDLIEQRLAGLSEQEHEALELIALSDPVRLDLLENLVDLRSIERLEALGLLDVLDKESGPELRLNHPLYGEVVRAHLPSIRKIRLSRALADAAEVRGKVNDRDTLRVAVWRLDGGGGGRLDTTLEAATIALRTENYALAARLSRSVWEEANSVDAAVVLGDSLDFLGRSREAERVLSAAAPLAETDRQRTSVAVRRASALFRTLGDAEGAERVIAEAVSHIRDGSCRREIDALRGNFLLLSGNVAGSIALDETLLLVSGDAAFAQASLDFGVGLALAGRTDKAISHTDVALSARTDLDSEEQLSAIGVYWVAQALAHCYAGHLKEAESIGDAGYQISVEKSNVDGQAWFASILGLIHLAQGRLVGAINMFRESASLFGGLNHPGRRWGLSGIALASSYLGDAKTAHTALVDLDHAAPTAVRMQDVNTLRARAWSTLRRGEVTAARELFWEAVSLGERWGQHATEAEALHDLIRIGAVSPAAERLERLRNIVDGTFMEARLSFAGAALRADVDLAAKAADQFDAMGANLFAAEASLLEGRLASSAGLRRRASTADARASRALEKCEGANIIWIPRSTKGSQLSDREREVALLAAQNLTSREIAERLFVSVRTVDNHLQQVYVKLGVKRRTDLAPHL